MGLVSGKHHQGYTGSYGALGNYGAYSARGGQSANEGQSPDKDQSKRDKKLTSTTDHKAESAAGTTLPKRLKWDRAEIIFDSSVRAYVYAARVEAHPTILSPQPSRRSRILHSREHMYLAQDCFYESASELASPRDSTQQGAGVILNKQMNAFEEPKSSTHTSLLQQEIPKPVLYPVHPATRGQVLTLFLRIQFRDALFRIKGGQYQLRHGWDSNRLPMYSILNFSANGILAFSGEGNRYFNVVRRAFPTFAIMFQKVLRGFSK